MNQADGSDIIASVAAVMGSARRVASVVATTTGASLAVASAVVFFLDYNRVAVTVVSMNQQCKELRGCQ
jgi:hypothetical protein